MTKFSKVLFPVDFSLECQRAAAYVIERAGKFEASLSVLHVVDPKTFHYHSGDLCLRPIHEIEDDQVAVHQKRFNDLVGRLFSGTKVEPCLKIGAEAETIAAFAQAGKFDVIMLPMRHQGFLSNTFADTLPAKVMELADCPVWTVAASDALSSGTPNARTLCALDFHADGSLDEQNQRILEVSKIVAQTLHSDITLLHVVAGDEPAGTPMSAWLGQQLLRLQEGMCEPVTISLLERGDVARSISQEASQSGASLVIAGRSHWQSWTGRVQPTVSRIVQSAPCPVLSVP
jgi:nucleotide-binding universal stress UspA family protein